MHACTIKEYRLIYLPGLASSPVLPVVLEVLLVVLVVGVVPEDVPKSQVVIDVLEDDPDAYSVTMTQTHFNSYYITALCYNYQYKNRFKYFYNNTENTDISVLITDIMCR